MNSVSKTSSICINISSTNTVVPKHLDKQFSVLKKCTNKFDCLVYKMLLIRELTLLLNVQSDSIQVKLLI